MTTSKSWVLSGILALFALVIAFARLLDVLSPEEANAVIAHELLKGRFLYSDLWDHKPPAIYMIYSFAEKLFGYGPLQVYVLGLIAALLTLWGCYRVGQMGGKGRSGGCWAALFWTAISTDMMLQANQPNLEVFMNLGMVCALYFLGRQEKISTRDLWLAGLGVGWACLLKPQMILAGFFFAAALAMDSPSWKRIGRSLPALVGPGLLAWFLSGLFFFLSHRWNDFYGALVTFNAYYARLMPVGIMERFFSTKLFPTSVLFLGPLALLALGGLALSHYTRRRWWLLAAAYAATCYLEVTIPGHFDAHHFQLWLPLLAITGGWSAEETARRFHLTWGWKAWIPAGLCLAWLAAYELPNYRLDQVQWSQKKYGDVFEDAFRLGKNLDKILKTEERFYVHGLDTGVYFASRRSPPSGILYSFALLPSPLFPVLSARLEKDLETNKPELIVMQNNNPAFSLYSDRYRFLTTYPEDGFFMLLVRKSGPLEKRLEGFEKNMLGK